MGHGHGHAPAHRRRRRTAGRLAVVLGLTLAGAGRPRSSARCCPARWPCSPTPATWPPTPPASRSRWPPSRLAQRPARGRRTFGWQRVEILAAVANGLLLLAVAGYVLVEAIRRIGHPPEIGAGLMLVVPSVGLVVNLVSLAAAAPRAGRVAERAGRLPRGARPTRSARSRSSSPPSSSRPPAGRRPTSSRRWSSAAWSLPRAWHLLREALRRPAGGRAAGGRPRTTSGRTSSGVDGVLDVHDLHAWTITSGLPVLSAHVVVTDEALAAGHGGRVLDALCSCLGEHFDVEHCTFQLEARGARRPRVARPRLKRHRLRGGRRGGTVEHGSEQRRRRWSTGSTRACGCPTSRPRGAGCSCRTSDR